MHTKLRQRVTLCIPSLGREYTYRHAYTNLGKKYTYAYLTQICIPSPFLSVVASTFFRQLKKNDFGPCEYLLKKCYPDQGMFFTKFKISSVGSKAVKFPTFCFQFDAVIFWPGSIWFHFLYMPVVCNNRIDSIWFGMTFSMVWVILLLYLVLIQPTKLPPPPPPTN